MVRLGARRRWWWRLWVPAAALGAITVGTAPAPGAVLAPGAGETAVCSGAPESTTVRTYPRGATADLATGSSALLCGNAKFGLRHIALRHTADWRTAATAARVVPWTRFADTALAMTLAQPRSVRCDPRRDTCAFRGVTAPGQHVVVVVARRDGKVITAFPAR